MNKLVNSDLSLSFDAVGEADDCVVDFIAFLKSNGLNAGKKPVAELLAGKRDEVAGFYLVAGDVSELVSADRGKDYLASVAKPVGDAEDAPVLEAPKPAPKASDADEKPAFSEDVVAAAIAEALKNGAPVVTAKPVTAVTPAAPKVKSPKVLKAVTPAGKVKAVRKGTKIANGLEALLGGVTAEALLACGIGDDVVDFCNRRVTKRGYGIALLEGGVIKLVLPEGVASVAYSG